MNRHIKESDVQKQILDYLILRKLMVWRNNNTPVFDARIKGGFRRQSKYTPKGVPDIVGILPGGKALFIEVKSPTGKVSPEQQYFIDTALLLGAVAGVARSVDDAKLLLRGYI